MRTAPTIFLPTLLSIVLECMSPPQATVAATGSEPGYWSVDDPRSGGMRDVMLLYVDGRDRYTAADLAPYVAYLDKTKAGKPLDWFYDAFLFLMFGGAPSGQTYIAGATNLRDWRYYVDALFAPGKNLGALDAAISAAAKDLGPPARRSPVILMIPYPSARQGAFGDVGGKPLDLGRDEDAMRAAEWLVDETARRFRAAGYAHLSLWGYYWMNEGISAGDEARVRATAAAVHDRGFGFHWIPWFNAPGIAKWRELGFDFVVMQPNYAFMPHPRDERRLALAAALCRRYNMGIEIEIPFQTLGSVTDRDTLSDYLNAGLPDAEGYLHTVHGYYQGTLDVGRLYASDLPANNRLYRDLYLFHKRTFDGRARAAEDRAAREIEFTDGHATAWIDLPAPLRVGEVRLQLEPRGGDPDSLFVARAYACLDRRAPGLLIGEGASTALRQEGLDLGAAITIRARPQIARHVRVDLSGPRGQMVLLHRLRAFPVGGATGEGTYRTDGEGARGVLTDGAYATSSADVDSLVRWPAGTGSITLDAPVDRLLSRLWLHLVKGPDDAWPVHLCVRVGDAPVAAAAATLRPTPADSCAAYATVELPRTRTPHVAIAIANSGGDALTLDEIEFECAPNLALGKPYRVEPVKRTQYPDSGGELTDGHLSQGFGDGRSIGWRGTGAKVGIILDLGRIRRAERIRVHVQGGGNGAVWLPQSVTVATSTDGACWTFAPRQITPPAEARGELHTSMHWLETDLPATPTRHVRIEFLTRGCWLMADEIQVLAEDANVARGCDYHLLSAPASAEKYADDGRKLTDGEVSIGRWASERAVGYSDADPTVAVDLLAPQTIDRVGAHVCGGGAAGIRYPETMTVQTSLDGVNWSAPTTTRAHPPELGADESTVALMEIEMHPVQARHVRLRFKRRGWCMVDEILIHAPE